MDDSNQALHEVQDRHRTESFLESTLIWVPFVGWCISGLLQSLRINAVRDDVAKQIQARTCFPVDAWDVPPVKMRCVREICDCIRDRFEWPNCFFLPADPIELLILDDEGLGYTALRLALIEEHETDIHGLVENVSRDLSKIVLAEVVDFVWTSKSGEQML